MTRELNMHITLPRLTFYVNKIRIYAVELYQGMATQTVQGVRQVAITLREPNCVTYKNILFNANKYIKSNRLNDSESFRVLVGV